MSSLPEYIGTVQCPASDDTEQYWERSAHRSKPLQFLAVCQTGQLLQTSIIRFQGTNGPAIPAAVIVLAILFTSMFLNILPLLKRTQPPIVVLDQRSQPSTVVSISFSTGELEDFSSMLEGSQGIDVENSHILPFKLPITTSGRRLVIRQPGIVSFR